MVQPRWLFLKSLVALSLRSISYSPIELFVHPTSPRTLINTFGSPLAIHPVRVTLSILHIIIISSPCFFFFFSSRQSIQVTLDSGTLALGPCTSGELPNSPSWSFFERERWDSLKSIHSPHLPLPHTQPLLTWSERYRKSCQTTLSS